ncbi:serine/threonine-protein kinase [Streptomyces sp. W16]|uniref:serine/threonine-protein kinase n=1 Tax=Streptomyces sp. W16 TaxID=3076631 RepID=UPI003FA3D114
MGRVWRAADEMLDRQVAVKEMRIDGLGAEDTRTRRERTLREARATARIDHPNVVRVYDVVDEGERLWIVMELVAGRSLERIMADDGPIGPREAARIGLGLVAALRQVHAGGVLHRDIKPGNVLVESRAQRVVLTDFGIAAIQDATALTMVGTLVGSPDYMAPERISGRPQGPPSDIWSLGATLCAALGGRSPFSRDTTLATLHAVLYEEPELPPAAGPLREVLAALLEKEPSVRPGLEEVEEALSPVAFPTEAEKLGSVETRLVEAPERPEEREIHQESPTPAFLEPSLVRAARDPRVHDPDPDPDPQLDPDPPIEDVIPTQRPAVAGVSLVRAERAERSEQAQLVEQAEELTEQKPVFIPNHLPAPRLDLGPHPARLPAPAEPFTPRHTRTRTHRRIGLIAAAAVAVVGAVVGTILMYGNGSSDDTATGSASKAPTSAPATPTEPSASASASAPASTEPSVSPSPSPSPTVEGTSRPPSLPPGTHQEAGGFAWATPTGWRRDLKTGAEVHYTSPDAGQELVGKSSLARGDLMRTWEASERNAHQGQDYRKIRLVSTTFRGYPAVVWEYTFTLKGVPWHARLLGFDADGKSYQINTWYQPDVETQALKTYDKVKNSFVVL